MKNLSLAEDHFADHFPGFPVMPAPLILEGLAQTGGILVGEANQFREERGPGQDAGAKFHREAMAGEQLTYTVEVIDLNETGGAGRPGTVHERAGPGGRGRDLVRPPAPEPAAAGAAATTKFVFGGELTHLLKMARSAQSGDRDRPDSELRPAAVQLSARPFRRPVSIDRTAGVRSRRPPRAGSAFTGTAGFDRWLVHG